MQKIVERYDRPVTDFLNNRTELSHNADNLTTYTTD